MVKPRGEKPPESLSIAKMWFSLVSLATSAYLVPPFTPFSSLTESQVQSWVFAGVNKSTVETQLAAEYANSVNGHSVKTFNF